MKQAKFRIYTKGKHEFLTTNWILFFVLVFTFAPAFIWNQIYGELPLTLNIIAISGIALLFILKFINIFHRDRREKLNGNFSGELTFHKDHIMISGKKYTLSEIDKIEIANNDFIGKENVTIANSDIDFNAPSSNGVDNTLTLQFKNGTSKKIYFQQKRQYELSEFEDIFKEYHNQNKISFLQLIDALGITDYDKIQDFKKHYR